MNLTTRHAIRSSAAVALVAAWLVWADPASAHHADVSGSCTDSTLTWVLSSAETATGLVTSPGPFLGQTIGPGGTLTETEPAVLGLATLSVTVDWTPANKVPTSTRTGEVLVTADCFPVTPPPVEPPPVKPPPVEPPDNNPPKGPHFEYDCFGKWKVTGDNWVLIEPSDQSTCEVEEGY